MVRPSLREKLACSAVDTLHTHGFKGCSIQDITEAAGVPKGSFFNHFENKEALAIDALRRYLDENARSDMLFDESVCVLTVVLTSTVFIRFVPSLNETASVPTSV